MDDIRQWIQRGYSIKWVGYHSPRHAKVHLHNESKEVIELVVELKSDYTEPSFKKILSRGADSPGSNTGTIWSSDTRLELLRLAAILGINVGGDALPGSGKGSIGHIGCAMGYDIESDRSRVPASSFATLSESILSLATYCSCGESKVFSFIPGVDFDYVLCKNSTDVVCSFLRYVNAHRPQWLVGYNNFSFDNARIQYHSAGEFDDILIRMSVGVGSSRSLACYIDSEGTYNIDLLTFLDKTARSKYSSLSLSNVARAEGLSEQKIVFDTLVISDFGELFRYNVQDSKVTMMLGIKAGIIRMMEVLSTVVCAPIIDIDRFTSGTFSCTAVASWCLHNRISMDWSPCTQYSAYKGAHVISPVIGMHERVYSCDFASMYPTILMSANISIENYVTRDTKRSHGSVWQTKHGTTFVLDGKASTFTREPPAILPNVVKGQVSERKCIKKSDPVKAGALKMSSNSLYGATGDKNSKIYAPVCSSSITLGGRWCLALAESVLMKFGYAILYGDTDSAHIGQKGAEEPKADPWVCTKILSMIFDHTPFAGMSMEVECLYEKIAYFGKKTYFGRIAASSEGPAETISKGMSKSRKDRIGVCRTLSSHVIEIILSNSPLPTKQSIIGDLISSVIDMAISNKLVLQDVSKIVKRSGQNYYEYMAVTGRRSYMECELYTGNESVQYSAAHVSSMVARELKWILTVTGIGSIETLLSMSTYI
jgi:DNA polymerase elongation subunit (family B)